MDNEECLEYIYVSDIFTETIVTEWNLICDKSDKNSLISSFALSGLLFGALSFGYLGDRIGRKQSLLLSAVGAAARFGHSTILKLSIFFLKK